MRTQKARYRKGWGAFLRTRSERATKPFPLRLCEVLEKEFVTTHGPLPETPSWLLREDDVDFAILGGYLQASLNSASITPLALIRQKLQDGGAVIPPAGPWPENSAETILQQLNKALIADGYTPAGDVNRALQECYKNALANANGNTQHP